MLLYVCQLADLVTKGFQNRGIVSLFCNTTAFATVQVYTCVGVVILNHCIKPPKTGRDLFWEA